MSKIVSLTESDLTNIVKKVINEAKDESDEYLSKQEVLSLLIDIWEKIPLGSRMNEGGMPRTIPLQIRDLLKKKGYEIVKKR
jgi:hypothetical protein